MKIIKNGGLVLRPTIVRCDCMRFKLQDCSRPVQSSDPAIMPACQRRDQMDPILLIEIIQMTTMIVQDSNCRTAVAQFELRQAVKHIGWKPNGPSITVTTLLVYLTNFWCQATKLFISTWHFVVSCYLIKLCLKVTNYKYSASNQK